MLLLVVQVNRGFHHYTAQQVALATATYRFNTLAAHAEQFAGLGFCRHFQLHAAIQRRHFDLTAQCCHREVNRYFTVQVVAFTLEDRVSLYLNLNVQIASRCAVFACFTLTRQADAVTGIHAGRDFHRQRFGFLYPAVAMAAVARVFDDLTAAMTVRTGLLHGKEALAHLHLALTVTGWTGHRRAAWLRAAAVTNTTLFQRRNADLFGHATNSFLEGQLHVVAQIGTAAGTLTAATTEDVAKYVAKDIAEVGTAAAKPTATAHAALFKRRMAVLIVGRTLLIVGQNFVRFLDLFKSGFGVLILVAVRMVLHRQAFIRLFDLTFFRRLGDAENLVIVFLRHYFCNP
ncbi:hypothetical protein D3C80_871200 [compost metagenome]